ncbi:MAG: hypothetical protein R2785_04140 [Flavobacteriaceae bacterium]
MKKITNLIIATLCIMSCTNESVTQPEDQSCDNGTFVGIVILKSQQEVDEFGAMCYSKIDGALQIGALSGMTDDITDLSPLSSIKEVFTSDEDNASGEGRFIIKSSNLLSLNGLRLERLATLEIYKTSLRNLNGLESLVEISNYGDYNHLIISENPMLENLNGLNNLVKIGTDGQYTTIDIRWNPMLENLDGLSGLIHIEGNLAASTYGCPDGGIVCGNNSLVNFCGLTNLVATGFNVEYGDIFQGNAYNPTVQDIINGNCSQ